MAGSRLRFLHNRNRLLFPLVTSRKPGRPRSWSEPSQHGVLPWAHSKIHGALQWHPQALDQALFGELFENPPLKASSVVSESWVGRAQWRGPAALGMCCERSILLPPESYAGERKEKSKKAEKCSFSLSPCADRGCNAWPVAQLATLGPRLDSPGSRKCLARWHEFPSDQSA